jgi:hypothetical protein
MTTINIGTNEKNIVGVSINKKFDDITYKDIQNIVLNELKTLENITIHGWCNVTNKKIKKQ